MLRFTFLLVFSLIINKTVEGQDSLRLGTDWGFCYDYYKGKDCDLDTLFNCIRRCPDNNKLYILNNLEQYDWKSPEYWNGYKLKDVDKKYIQPYADSFWWENSTEKNGLVLLDSAKVVLLDPNIFLPDILQPLDLWYFGYCDCQSPWINWRSDLVSAVFDRVRTRSRPAIYDDYPIGYFERPFKGHQWSAACVFEYNGAHLVETTWEYIPLPNNIKASKVLVDIGSELVFESHLWRFLDRLDRVALFDRKNYLHRTFISWDRIKVEPFVLPFLKKIKNKNIRCTPDKPMFKFGKFKMCFSDFKFFNTANKQIPIAKMDVSYQKRTIFKNVFIQKNSVFCIDSLCWEVVDLSLDSVFIKPLESPNATNNKID